MVCRLRMSFMLAMVNLHPLVLYDPGDPEQVAKTHAITGEVLKLSIDEGGAVSGEHGIGSEKCLFYHACTVATI
jgi:FAD/FMN-containing dehydrogenase